MNDKYEGFCIDFEEKVRMQDNADIFEQTYEEVTQ